MKKYRDESDLIDSSTCISAGITPDIASGTRVKKSPRASTARVACDDLYGNDAPEAVAELNELFKTSYFSNKTFFSLKDGMLLGGDEILVNEVENKKNNVALEKGVICAKMGKKGTQKTYQFYIITEDNAKVDESYIAIGKIEDLSTLNSILEGIKTDSNGKITSETAPKITYFGEDTHNH